MLLARGLGNPGQKGYLLVIGLAFGKSRDTEQALLTDSFVI